jgi:hypothetical protein
MAGQRHGGAGYAAPHSHRIQVRYAAAAASAVAAAIYLGIGVGALKVVDGVSAAAPDMFAFGAPAAAAFALGTFLLLAFDRRVLWVLGAVFQVGVIAMYFAVAPQRTPPFEIWGIALKVLQAAILAALVYLAVQRPAESTRPVPIAPRAR